MSPEAIWDAACETWSVGRAELDRLASAIDRVAFTKVVEAIGDCRGRIAVAGVGTSGAAAKKIAHSLCCIERPAFFLSPGDGVHGALGAVQPDDIAILISKGGNSPEIVRLVASLKAKRVFIIAVTENENSEIGRAADQLLKIRIEREADRFNMLATTSTMAVIAVFDAVCIALMTYTGYSREQFAIIHPSGAVGERLLAGKE
ncbi:KpsF/GutQ family sugar-phosphate isomerase [Pleomorphomonas carboxyditropha]|uniref:Phosphosugar isomerase n=1 Tax=Pleomorphomonas carboxyditropha TaxID=2023338 RepID=A0A2G9WZZ3_9HYPH|nr:SIS domain-containing protein [Pleomorphomonas carboxyditropha]PIP00287.1 phosphosugar isomerase [Pleomorphomonas carboxyditropha]